MDTPAETYNPWSVVHLVFSHLANEGLHPILGESGDPGVPAAELLRALGIVPDAEGNRNGFRTGQEGAGHAPGGVRGRTPRKGLAHAIAFASAPGCDRLSQVESQRAADPGCDPGHKDFRGRVRPKEGCR